MTIPNMPRNEFMNQDPGQLFITLTAQIYEARKAGRLDDIAAILEPFDEDAKRALLTGASALLVLAPGEYRDALRASLAKQLYNELKAGGEKK